MVVAPSPTKTLPPPTAIGGPGAKYHPRAPAKPKRAKLTVGRILHLVRRLAIFACAVGYVVQCFSSCYTATGLLRGRDNPSIVSHVGTFDLIAKLAGNRTIRESGLIKNAVLGDRTDPVNGTLYLQPDKISFTKCANLAGRQSDVYDNEFLRSVYTSLVEDTSYHITEISASEVELIAPVVDCTTSDITDGDTTTGRFFFLVRERAHAEVVHLLILSMSNQQHSVPQQGIKGPAGIATIQHIHDMQERDVETHFVLSTGYPYETISFRVYDFLNETEDGQWTLQNIPATEEDLIATVETANREGFFIKAESEQSNVNNAIWVMETEPHRAIATWTWVTKAILHDSWAWVHAVQFFIGMGILSNLVILCLATYRNFLAGKWWIGDAFVSISTSQLVNGAAVLISWFMNEYWVLHEFCFHIGFKLSGATSIHLYEAPMRVDLFTIYLSACGLIGLLFKERIDPLLAAACFHLGFDLRLRILQALPAIHDSIVEYAKFAYVRGVSASLPGQERISPMQLWLTHPIGTRNYTFVARCIFPVFSTLPLVVLYVGIRKVYRYFHPDSVHVQRNTKGTVQSSTDEAFTTQKRVLTLFEVATGAELENRYGLVSDYEPCLFIKGMKFASADGIYSTGFLIANQKFLLQTSDYWSIVLMKIIRRRYKNIYVYDVNGSTVQQTARLVYPHTLSFQDLVHINISVLS